MNQYTTMVIVLRISKLFMELKEFINMTES